MKQSKIFSDTNTAFKALTDALESDNWQDYFLVTQDGDMISLYSDKETVRLMNSIVPTGGFFSEVQATMLLHEILNDFIDEIVQWLVNGSNMPMRIFNSYPAPVGYSFDSELNEQSENQVQLVLRRDRKGNTKLGFFVSTFHPVRESASPSL